MFNTYPEFEASVEGMCAQLKTFPHDRVAFWAAASPETVYLFFACWKLGKIACPLNTRLPFCEKEVARLETELFTPQPPQLLPPVPWEWEENNLATMVFTSGSTGTPKIACHSIANHLYNAKGSAIPLTSQDRWLLSLPLFHVGGIAILFRCYLAQAQIVLPSQNYDGITHLSLVPTQLKRMIDNNVPLPHIKYIMLGGSPLPNFSTPWNVVPTYGMTEMSSQIASAGIVHPYAELKIADDGEIWVKGKTLFQGYYTHGRIELPVDEEGWFATKDLGRFNAEGKLEIIGRKDNLFISGGENIQPEEIEAALKKLPGVAQAVVVPIPDPEFGSRPVVFLDPPLPLSEIEKALSPILPKYKIPICAFPLPETEGFKHNRRELKEIAIKRR